MFKEAVALIRTMIVITKNTLIFCLLIAIGGSGVLSDDPVDEGSCICGLNLEILEKLNSIVQATVSAQICPSVSQPTILGSHDSPGSKPHGQISLPSDTSAQSNELNTITHQTREPDSNGASSFGSESSSVDEPAQGRPTTASQDSVKINSESSRPDTGQAMGGEGSRDENLTQVVEPLTSSQTKRDKPGSNEIGSTITSLTDEIDRLKAQLLAMQGAGGGAPSTQIVAPQTGRPSINHEYSTTLAGSTSGSNQATIESDASKTSIGGGGYTISLPSAITDLSNEALAKLNQSREVNPNEMASALQSTVPSVVSNIFSNIQNLTAAQQAGQTSKTDNPNELTSIDGSSVSISAGSTSNEIEAKGERLFLTWVEHQLASLHLTASVADYIRKAAVNMFRRIVTQYVERVNRLGGNIDSNVRVATQMALTTTENLTLLLLRNYINFAGGLMQIIGEQVSRVGKNLDSTGNSIAHANLNPFDIVSNVIDSLPNPSDYSKYFRAFGKHIMGESGSSAKGQQQAETNSEQAGNQQADESSASASANNSDNQAKPQQNILAKTMKTLSKTVSSWIG